MFDQLRAMAVFSKTVETGSFRGAASALGLSPSVVSHHVSRLEDHLGTALLYRSTRRISLTDAGERLFVSARSMVEAAESGLAGVAGGSARRTGRLRVSFPALLERSPLMQRVAVFAHDHPGVHLALDFTDRARDLIDEGIDLALRIGPLPDSSLRARRLFDIERRLVASPGYVAAHPTPQSPEDLRHWDWIGLSMRQYRRTFRSPDNRPTEIEYEPRITVDSVEASCELAIAGLGLVTPAEFLIRAAIERGELVEVLPEWRVEPLGAFAVWPPNARRESLTYQFIEYLQTADAAGSD